MEFRAGVYKTGYLGHFLTVVFCLVIVALLSAGDYADVGKIVVVVAIVVARLRARKMSFGDRSFRYDGWFRSMEIPYSEIIKVENSEELGYPTNHRHGPLEYRLTTEEDKCWVSLMWFGVEACRMFHERIFKQRPKRKPRSYTKSAREAMSKARISWYSLDSDLKVHEHLEVDVGRAIELVGEYYARGFRTYESGEDAIAATMFGFSRSPAQFIEFCVHGPSEISYTFESADLDAPQLSGSVGDTFRVEIVLFSKEEIIERVKEFFAFAPSEIQARLQDDGIEA